MTETSANLAVLVGPEKKVKDWPFVGLKPVTKVTIGSRDIEKAGRPHPS